MSPMPQPTRLRRRYQLLEDAASLLRVGAAAELAHLTGDEERLDILLGQLTPSAWDELAGELERWATADREAQAAARRLHLQASPPPPGPGPAPPQSLARVIPLRPRRDDYTPTSWRVDR